MCILKGSEFRGRMFFFGAWALVLCPRVDDFHTHRLMAGPLAESGLLGGPAYFPGGECSTLSRNLGSQVGLGGVLCPPLLYMLARDDQDLKGCLAAGRGNIGSTGDRVPP